MKHFLLAILMLTAAVGISITTASGQGYTSTTACRAASAWDAAAAKCVSCQAMVTDAKLLKSCKACRAGTAFNVAAARCVTVTVRKS
jgi:hypothetical protein